MLARRNLPDDPALCPQHRASCESSDLRDVLDPDGIDTHTLLLLYLLPETSRSDLGQEMLHAVEALSDVQSRLCVETASLPFEKERLAAVIESLSAMRFGCH